MFFFFLASLVGDDRLSLDNDDDELLGFVNVFNVFQATVFTNLFYSYMAPSLAHGTSFMLAPIAFS